MNDNDNVVNNQKTKYIVMELTESSQKKIQEKYKMLNRNNNYKITIDITFKLNSYGLVDVISTKVNNQQIEGLTYEMYYHSYISLLSKSTKKSKELLKYFSDNEDRYSKIISRKNKYRCMSTHGPL